MLDFELTAEQKALVEESRRFTREKIVPIAGDKALQYTRELAQKEGIFCGVSSGGTFTAAMEIAQSAPAGTNILCMLPDTGERYLSTPLFEDIPEGPDDGQNLLDDLDY